MGVAIQWSMLTVYSPRIMAKSYFRGHPIIYVNNVWLYEDTKTRAGCGGEERPCKKCFGKASEDSGNGYADPCLGILPGVENACCGHGVRSRVYIRFTNGVEIRGFSVKV